MSFLNYHHEFYYRKITKHAFTGLLEGALGSIKSLKWSDFFRLNGFGINKCEFTEPFALLIANQSKDPREDIFGSHPVQNPGSFLPPIVLFWVFRRRCVLLGERPGFLGRHRKQRNTTSVYHFEFGNPSWNFYKNLKFKLIISWKNSPEIHYFSK